MALILFIIVVFVILLMFPIALGFFSLRKKGVEAMEIEQSKIRDPRYFAKSFTSLFEESWKDYDGSGKLMLSHEENILEADQMLEYPTVCNSIIFAEKQDFRPQVSQAGVRFEKEIYARHNAYLDGIETIRAASAKKDLFLGSDTKVIRWVDAEGTLTVDDGCDLGISASSATKILLKGNCRFRRLYAPIVFIGKTPLDEEEETKEQEDLNQREEEKQQDEAKQDEAKQDEAKQDEAKQDEAKQDEVLLLEQEQYKNVTVDDLTLDVIRNIKYVEDHHADEDGLISASIISKQEVSVLNGLTVKGHIRSNKGIRLYDNVVIYGNIFAEDDIYLGQNVRVNGSVFTQGNIYTEEGVVIGQPGKIKSMIARGEIHLHQNSRVHGYVSSEMGGDCSL